VFLQDYTYVLKHKAEVENRVADALSRRRALLSVMSTDVVGFEKIKDTYESCPDFENIYTILSDSLTHEVDDFLLQDGYLFRSRMLCIPRTCRLSKKALRISHQKAESKLQTWG